MALRQKYLRRSQARADTLVLDELSLLHARGRVDLAVIGQRIDGYEIKSARDSLARLPHQLDIYRRSLHTLTLVVAPRHLPAVVDTVPEWCGVLRVTLGPRGAYWFRSLRRPRRNPDLDPFFLAHLLWRAEAQAALAELGASDRDLRGARKDLYRQLSETMSVSDLTALIKRSMVRRRAWRDLPQPSSCDASFPRPSNGPTTLCPPSRSRTS